MVDHCHKRISSLVGFFFTFCSQYEKGIWNTKWAYPPCVSEGPANPILILNISTITNAPYDFMRGSRGGVRGVRTPPPRKKSQICKFTGNRPHAEPNHPPRQTQSFLGPSPRKYFWIRALNI